MAIFRVQKNSNYTVISNIHLKDRRMSLKSKGLLSIMLSLPPEWDFSIAGLVSLGIDKETAVKSSLKELENLGYLRIEKVYPDQSESGRIEYIYDIFESPELAKQEGKKQELENLPLEILPLENHGLLNTKLLNTYILNTDNIGEKSENPRNYPKDEYLATKNLTPLKAKKSRKEKMILFRKMIDGFTQSDDIRSLLYKYLDIRGKKGLEAEQWDIILKDLREYAGQDKDIAEEMINSAIAGGYMQIIPSWEKKKVKGRAKRKSFDNTAGVKNIAVVSMTKEQKEDFYNNLVKDEAGNLLQF